MNQVFSELNHLQSALLQVAARMPTEDRAATMSLIVPFVRSIRRKCGSVMVHQAILSAIRWETLDDIGREGTSACERSSLEIELPDASLILRHRTAAVDHVYMAFDGLISGVANVTDTLGRLLNACYAPGIEERQASLLAVGRAAVGAPLGRVIADGLRTEWLGRVRDLRGRCQHADIEEVVVNPCMSFGRSEEPCIPRSYDWSNPAADTPLTKYAREVVVSTEGIVCDIIAIVLEHGGAAALERPV